MAFTARLPEKLLTEAQAHAAGLGISLNALLAVALSDYLAGRRRPSSKSAEPSPPPAPAKPSADESAALLHRAGAVSYRRPASMSDPCPCGAKNRDGHRLKWKHCHGKL